MPLNIASDMFEQVAQLDWYVPAGNSSSTAYTLDCKYLRTQTRLLISNHTAHKFEVPSTFAAGEEAKQQLEEWVRGRGQWVFP